MFRFSMLSEMSSCAAIPALLALTACGGDKSDPGAARDTSSSASGTTTTSSTTGAGGTGNASGGNCVPTVPPNANISDFAVWEDGNWGGDMDLTGGTFEYSGDTSSIELGVEDEALHVTGTVNNYAGFGMWFGPCVDASGYAGISFSIGGTIGAMGQAVLQVQQSDNKEVEPVDGGARGDCDSSIDECTYNQGVYAVPEAAETVSVCFANMSGGSPNPEVDSSMLYALQYQFNCETDGMCEVDAVIDDIAFTPTCE